MTNEIRDTKKEVLVDVPANKGLLTMSVHEESTETTGLFFKSVGITSPYKLYHGKSIYDIDSIKFYNDQGIRYENRGGWLEGAYSKRFRTMQFDIDEKFEFKKASSSGTVDFVKYYKANQIFFISLGKDWNGENRAVLFVPMTYLDSIGYQVIKATTTTEYSVREETKLYTPMFQIYISGNTTKLIGSIKASMRADLEKCESSEELQRFLKSWENRV